MHSSFLNAIILGCESGFEVGGRFSSFLGSRGFARSYVEFCDLNPLHKE